jgi:hypothetical protein
MEPTAGMRTPGPARPTAGRQTTGRRMPAARPAPMFVAVSRAATPLYRHAGVLVTYDLLEVNGHRYRVAGLRRLRTARSSRRTVTGATAVLAGAVLAAVGIGISFGLHPGGPGPLTYAVLAAAALLPTTAVLAAGRRARRSHELWGDHGGTTTLLYASTDEREFGQVTRAVMRACEAARR